MGRLNELNITWKDVLDCSKKWYGVINNARNQAYECEYKYFNFNSIIYRVTDAGFMDTGLTIDDLRYDIDYEQSFLEDLIFDRQHLTTNSQIIKTTSGTEFVKNLKLDES